MNWIEIASTCVPLIEHRPSTHMSMQLSLCNFAHVTCFITQCISWFFSLGLPAPTKYISCCIHVSKSNNFSFVVCLKSVKYEICKTHHTKSYVPQLLHLICFNTFSLAFRHHSPSPPILVPPSLPKAERVGTIALYKPSINKS